MNKTIAIFALAAAVTSTAITASASTFTIEGSDNSFTIKPSGDTSAAETVQYRTVSLSAYPGQNYIAKSDTIYFTPLGVTVDGTDVGLLAGPGWSYDPDAKQLTISADCTLSGSNGVGAVSVLVSADCTVTLSNLCLRCSDGYTTYAPVLLDSNVAATFVLVGDNTLRAVQPRAGIGVPPGTSLTVTGDGRLDAAGGYMGAGIGGWLTTGCGTVSIEGGIITLGRGTEAACIGGGSYGAGGDVAISGGTILLREYTSAPIPNSIGRGHSSTGSDGTLTITGGSLCEVGSSGTRAIDLSLFGSAPTNAAGEALSSVTVSNLAPNASVAFNGLPAYYGTDSIVADAHGNVYLWLPDGDWSGIVTDIVCPAYLDGADDNIKTNWVNWAVQYNAGTNAEYEAAFLLGISPATAIPAGASMLKVVDFQVTENGYRFELASDVCDLYHPDGDAALLCNGYAAVKIAANLSEFFQDAGSSQNAKGASKVMTDPIVVDVEKITLPVPVTIDATTGHAVIDLNISAYGARKNMIGFTLPPPPLFFRVLLTPIKPDYMQELRNHTAP